MSDIGRMVLTNKGAALLQKIQHEESLALNFTAVVVGSGQLSENDKIVNLTALKEPETAEVNILSNKIIQGGESCILARIEPTDASFFLREVGLIAADPDEGDILYAYCNFGEYADFVRFYGGSAAETQEIEIYTYIGNCSEVHIDITDNVMVTMHDLETEQNTRITADNTLDGKITDEKSARTAADNALDGKIAAEKTARENADNALAESVYKKSETYTQTEVDNKLSMLEMNIDWKEAVDSFSDIAATYPNPQDGDTVNVKDTDYTYRYNGAEWIAISANSIPKATNAIDGLMSKEDKSKLAGIAAGAQVNSITGVKGSAETSYRTGNVNITAADIGLGNVTNDKQATKAEFNAHIGNTNNPHNVTKSQVGLGNVDNTSDKDKPISTATQIALNEIDSLVYNIDPSNDGIVEMFDALVGKNFIRANEDNTITMKFDDIILGKKYYVIAKNINNIDYGRYYNKLILYSDILSDNYSYYDCTLSAGYNEEYDFQVNNYRSVIYFSINNSSENDYEDSKGQLVKRMIANIDIVNPIILEDLAAKFDVHTSNKNNPHNVTKSQVGLGNVKNTEQATKEEFDAMQTVLNNKFGLVRNLTVNDDLNNIRSTGWYRVKFTAPENKNYPVTAGTWVLGVLEIYDIDDMLLQILRNGSGDAVYYRHMQTIWENPIRYEWGSWKKASTNDYTTRDKDVVNNICWKNKSFNKSGWYRIAQMPKAVTDAVSAIVQIGKSFGNIWTDGVMFAITTNNEYKPNITQLTRSCRSGDYIFPKCRLLAKGINKPEYLEIYVNNWGNNNWENFDYNIYGMSGYIQTIDDATLTESIPDGYTSYEFTFSNSGIKTDIVRAESLYGTVINSSGADGAELMEWADGNPLNKDRCGYFVALTGRKIRIANSNDDLRKVSVISGNYSFLGNNYTDCWHGKYKKDVYGRRITKDVIHPVVTDDNGNIISEEYTTKEYILNDDYDESKAYIPRSERPEWDAVICYGQVVVRDDGTCIPDGFCKPNDEGKATYANDGFYVMDRIDENNILIKI